MWGARRNYLSQSLIIKLSQSLGTPVPIAAKFHKKRQFMIVKQEVIDAIRPMRRIGADTQRCEVKKSV